MKPQDFTHCIELVLRPGVVVAVVATKLTDLADVIRFVGGPAAKLDMEAVQEVEIVLKQELHPPTRRFTSLAKRPNNKPDRT